MNAQAEQMKVMVNELVALVGSNDKDQSAVTSATRTTTAAHQVHHVLPAVAKAGDKQVAVHQSKEVKPEDVIPMEDDFKDF